jgi:hypothetical protein
MYTLDWRIRRAVFIHKLPDETVLAVLDILGALLDSDQS